MRFAGVAAMVVGATLIYFVFIAPKSAAAPGNTIVAPPASPSQGGPPSLLDNPVVALARGQLGKKYLFGATSDPTLKTLVYDCSSLVQSIFEDLGFTGVPRTSQQQAAASTPVSTPQPGDLAFGSFETANDHVGIYVGNGQVISALDEGHGVVQTDITHWPGLHFGRLG